MSGAKVAGPQPPQLTDANLAARQAKIDQAMSLRIGYASYAEIAKAMGCSRKTAHKWVQAGLKQLTERNMETAERVRAMELARLDRLSMKVAMGTTAPRVADTLVRIADRRARLLGLDAPTQITGPGGGPIPLAAVELSEDERRERMREYFSQARAVAAVAAGETAPVAEVPAP